MVLQIFWLMPGLEVLGGFTGVTVTLTHVERQLGADFHLAKYVVVVVGAGILRNGAPVALLSTLVPPQVPLYNIKLSPLPPKTVRFIVLTVPPLQNVVKFERIESGATDDKHEGQSSVAITGTR